MRPTDPSRRDTCPGSQSRLARSARETGRFTARGRGPGDIRQEMPARRENVRARGGGAGLVARRILCYVRPGDRLLRGQRFGFIRFGSRVDLYLPPEARARVAVGDKVYAGRTIVASLAEIPNRP